tara:strand:- start:8501 stop:8695 length:195 start_codon:yes stop_codon:yes gene_type:complete
MLTIISFSLAAFGILLFIKGFTKLQVRDKRFNIGIKKKFNWISVIFFIISFICFFLAYRFYYFS